MFITTITNVSELKSVYGIELRTIYLLVDTSLKYYDTDMQEYLSLVYFDCENNTLKIFERNLNKVKSKFNELDNMSLAFVLDKILKDNYKLIEIDK